MCLSAKGLIAFYASKNIIAAEYLQNVSCESRPLFQKSRLIDTLSSRSSAVHAACRDKIPGVVYSMAWLWIVAVWFPLSDFGLKWSLPQGCAMQPGRKTSTSFVIIALSLAHREAIATDQGSVQSKHVSTELFSGEGGMDKILNAVFYLPFSFCSLTGILFCISMVL